jgi:hypothetical protein
LDGDRISDFDSEDVGFLPDCVVQAGIPAGVTTLF